jgi:hypothetical protein
MTIAEAERIAIEANADPEVHIIHRVRADQHVAEALALMWRTHLGSAPPIYPPFDLVDAVEAQICKPVWSWS